MVKLVLSVSASNGYPTGGSYGGTAHEGYQLIGGDAGLNYEEGFAAASFGT